MELKAFALFAASIFEVCGVGVMLGGALLAPVVLLIRRIRDRTDPSDAYRWLRNYLGASILLGLELLVAADIVRTVSSEPTLRGVLVLGLIVVIRTFLSFTLEVELRGTWPVRDARHTAERRQEQP